MMHNWLAPAAIVTLLALAACDSMTAPPSLPPDEMAARDACRAQARGVGATPEGNGLVGSQDFDRYMAACMRSKGFGPRR
jgi:hypothetical protein